MIPEHRSQAPTTPAVNKRRVTPPSRIMDLHEIGIADGWKRPGSGETKTSAQRGEYDTGAGDCCAGIPISEGREWTASEDRWLAIEPAKSVTTGTSSFEGRYRATVSDGSTAPRRATTFEAQRLSLSLLTVRSGGPSAGDGGEGALPEKSSGKAPGPRLPATIGIDRAAPIFGPNISPSHLIRRRALTATPTLIRRPLSRM